MADYFSGNGHILDVCPEEYPRNSYLLKKLCSSSYIMLSACTAKTKEDYDFYRGSAEYFHLDVVCDQYNDLDLNLPQLKEWMSEDDYNELVDKLFETQNV